MIWKIIDGKLVWLCKKCRTLNTGTAACNTTFKGLTCNNTPTHNKLMTKAHWTWRKRKQGIENETYKQYIQKMNDWYAN